MAADINPPTRSELASFLPSPRLIRAFEKLFEADATEDTPLDQATLEQNIIDTFSAQASAQQALSAIQGLTDAVNALLQLPPPVSSKRARYGSFFDTTTQTAAAINTAYPVTFNTTDLSNGVYIGTPTSRIYVDEPAVYNFQFSVQLDKTLGGVAIFDFWARVNGVDVPNSNGRVRIQGNNAELIQAWNYVLSLKAGDYFELVWATDDITCVIQYYSAAAPHPATPSVILTVTTVP